MINNIFDSHAHYDDEQFDGDRAIILSSLQKNGVRAVVNVACDIRSSNICERLAQEYDFVYATAGIHPQAAEEYTPADLETMALLLKGEKMVAIGEIGLDYHYEGSSHDAQKAAFAAQLSLARQLDKPVVIHSRDATADTIVFLKKYRPKGVVHCFSGSAEIAKEILSFGLYLGFTGVVTFSNAKRVLEAVAATPTNRLLLETDCPYMAPAPFRGKRCDSTMIAYTAAKIAEIKGLDPQELVNIATENACRLYGLAT